MPPKLFTLEEANRLLPRLEPWLRRLVAGRRTLPAHQAVLEDFRTRAGRNGGGVPGDLVRTARGAVLRLGPELQRDLDEVESLGCFVKDLDQGLVDFPTRRGGEHVFLCWRLGEPAIHYWHGLTEGFAGRKPIGDDPPD